jgi:hypothetical protein
MNKFTQSIKRTLSDSPSSQSVKKSCDEKVSVFGQVNDFLKYHIVWYNEQHEDPLEHYNISSKFLRGVLDYLECFINVETCQKYIQSLRGDTTSIILIISMFSQLSTPLIDDRSLFNSVHSIYIHQEGCDQPSFAEAYVENGKRHDKV